MTTLRTAGPGDRTRYPTGSASLLADGFSGQEIERLTRRLREPADAISSPRPIRVINKLIVNDLVVHGDKTFKLVKPLRVVIEEFGSGGTTAFLVADKTFSAFGDTEGEAEEELLALIHADVVFYESTPSVGLTADARSVKAWLRDLYKEIE